MLKGKETLIIIFTANAAVTQKCQRISYNQNYNYENSCLSFGLSGVTEHIFSEKRQPNEAAQIEDV